MLKTNRFFTINKLRKIFIYNKIVKNTKINKNKVILQNIRYFADNTQSNASVPVKHYGGLKV